MYIELEEDQLKATKPKTEMITTSSCGTRKGCRMYGRGAQHGGTTSLEVEQKHKAHPHKGVHKRQSQYQPNIQVG